VTAEEIKRDLFLASDVNAESTVEIIKEIIKANSYDDEQERTVVDYKREPIKLYVQSVGGNVYDCWALVDVMLHSKTPIHTYCTGYAMSCGFIIYLAGSKRFATKHSTFVYHQISSSYPLTKFEDLVNSIAEDSVLQEMMEQFVVERTNIKKSELEDIKKQKIDLYMHIENAVRSGVVDEVLK
jgi:ATP-dependent Clp protease protease subunit